MLTPSFNISQTEDHVILSIHAPYTQLNDVEINALGSQFWFYSSPYFLRLTFPCGVVDDDEPPASFNADSGDFEITLTKQTRGEHFPDLDLLGTLLAPRKQQPNVKPSIEVLSGDTESIDSDEEDPDEWLIDQELPSPQEDGPLNAPKYGFANQTQGVFQQVKSEFKEIIELVEPDVTPASQRDVLRLAEEDRRFCPDHYLADLMEPAVLEEVMNYSPPWHSHTHTSDQVKLNGEEKEALKKIGNKEFLLTKEDKSAVWLSLVDIVFAFAYNHRTTLGEDTVESAWTVNKLSATLSWFTTYTSLHNVVVTSFRRLLTYSLYRNWDLAQLVLKDTIEIFKLGRRQVLKCLLSIHELFNHSEPRYLLNQLYIKDYCIWLQRASDSKLNKLVSALEQVTVTKQEMGFELDELEHAALLVAEEEEEGLADQVARLNINNSRSSSSSSSSYETDSDDSSSSLDSDDNSSPET